MISPNDSTPNRQQSSGGPEIDAVRRDVALSPTSSETYERRALLLYLWIGALQQRGADTRSFYATDTEFHRLQRQLGTYGSAHDVAPIVEEPAIEGHSAGPRDRSDLQKQMFILIDRAFSELELIQDSLVGGSPIATPFECDGRAAPTGDMEAEWPEFQGNNRNTGFTTAPGPQYGRTAWKLPVGLGWYSRPVIEGSCAYLASPGMNTTCFCVDLDTGEEVWRSTQAHPSFGVYKYPAMASTPLVLNEKVILREINSHGGDEGQARNLVYIDKHSGRTLRRTYAGHIDYRTQYAPAAANEEYVVYPFGVHDIYSTPPVCQNLNRLICANRDNTERYWDINIGNIDALAEPVLSGEIALCGTTEGYLYALRLGSSPSPILWSFRAEGAVNTAVAVDAGRVYFGCNGGFIYCLEAESGAAVWKIRPARPDPAARKHFSTPAIHGGRLYVGDANRGLHCLDLATGSTVWRAELSDWIRSRPATTSRGVFAATLDGRLHLLSAEGDLVWSRTVTTHPIYADLAGADMAPAGPTAPVVVLVDSNLIAFCVDLNGEVLWEKSLLDSFIDENGNRIFTDQLSGGTYYQSKPTTYGGRLYFGSPSGFLFAVDAGSGEEVWRFEMGAAISVGPACADGRIFAGQQGGERFFYCLSATDGSLLWRQTLPGGWVWGSATVDEGLVYVPTVSGYAVCLDAHNGHIIWMYPTAKSVPAEPAVDGDLVYFGSWSRSLYALDKRSGDIVWKQNGVSLDSGTLVVENGRVYVPHHSNIFSSFDAITGEVSSTGNHDERQKGNRANFNATPAFHAGRAFFSARGGTGLLGVPLFSTVYCVDTETGDIKWTYRDGGGLSAPAVASGRVYIASGNSPFLYCLAEGTGEPIWIHRLGHRTEESTLCIYRNRLYALCADGFVHSIE